MLRSMFSGVSALRNHQIMMDVIGNNIANVNTVGFKSSRAIFQETLNQTLQNATAPTSTRGGTNPRQVGLGVTLGGIVTHHTPGNLQASGSTTDVAIEGDGFFIVGSGDQRLFTRAGTFDFDQNGSLVHITTGMHVYGWLAQNGVVNTSQPVEPLRVPIDQMIAPLPTTRIEYSGNLDARTTGTLAFDGRPIVITSADGQKEISVSFELQPTGSFNEWEWRVKVTGEGVNVVGGSGTLRVGPTGEIIFQSATEPIRIQLEGTNEEIVIDVPTADNNGVFAVNSIPAGYQVQGEDKVASTYTPPQAELATIHVFDTQGARHDVIVSFERISLYEWTWKAEDRLGNPIGGGELRFSTSGVLESQTGSIVLTPTGVEPVEIEPDFSSLTQFASSSTVAAVDQNGYPAGELETVSIDSVGRIIGSFSNGLLEVLGQLALATFRNPGGLHKEAGTLFRESSNSGMANIGAAGTGNRGTVAPGNLEMSNVDLGMEFTHMIITQRGYQANSRIITTSDEMLQELVNLKR